jgi:hypothetical protein
LVACQHQTRRTDNIKHEWFTALLTRIALSLVTNFTQQAWCMQGQERVDVVGRHGIRWLTVC